MIRHGVRYTTAIVAVLLAAGAGDASAQGPRDALIQPPTFKQPERGSLVGGLAKLAIGAEDASRGSYALPLPVEVPSERAAMLVGVIPSYAPENGVSEWGVGWSAGLAIQRFRVIGDIDYQTDGFTSPWGRLAAGDDGFYYPAGLKGGMRLQRLADRWLATSPSGTRTTFAQVITTPEGGYAWYPTRAETLLGEVTEVQYATSAGGRPFVTRVIYGGPESPQTYRLELQYQTLALPLTEYRSGYPLVLDRRVTRVVAFAKQGGNGAERERWRYDLSYRDSQFGPGFYLNSVMRTFASGETEPPVTYDYELPGGPGNNGLEFQLGQVEDTPKLQRYLDATRDPDGLMSEWVAVTDADEDGLPDLEHGMDFTLFRQTATGDFVSEPLPPRPGNADVFCRPSDSIFNQARTVVRMAGSGTPLQVLVLDDRVSTTVIRACDRAGVERFATEVPGRWTLSSNMKIADLNRDEKPDLVMFDHDGTTGTYQVLENVSGRGCPGASCSELGFVAHPARPLTFMFGRPFTPSAVWVHDMNGDGNPDLLLRSDDRISIWYGRGRFEFDPQEHQLPFLNRDGWEMFNLGEWQATWIDVNADGLTDTVMSFGREGALFINEGDHFQEAVAPTLELANLFGLGAPLIGDWRGRGDPDLNFIVSNSVESASLTDVSTGLLIEADDGKGTTVRFGYRRAAAHPGLRQRPAVLGSLTVSTAGYDDVHFQYDYAAAQVHSVGHFLLGFGTVTVDAPQSRNVVDFHHDDDVAGQVEASRSADERTPGLMKIGRTVYEEARFSSVRLRRAVTSWSGWCQGSDWASCIAGSTPAVLDRTDTLVFERGICPTHTRKADSHGQLDVVTRLTSPASLTGALHCVADGQTWTGRHTDPTRDFVMENHLTLNDLGQPTKIEQRAGGQTLTLQDLTYDPATHRLRTLAVPGRGVQSFTFDPITGQLASTTAVDGVIVAALNRDPLTDALKELLGDHGPGGVLTSSFRYDGMERLARRWADVGGSNEAQPLQAITYQFPTAELPAFVHVDELIDATARSFKESVSWSYPDGAELTSASRIPGGWVFGVVSEISRTELRGRKYRRAPLADATDPGLATYGAVRRELTRLGETLTAAFGHAVSVREAVQQGVERQVSTGISIANGRLVTSTLENGSFETRTETDAAGHTVSLRDQAGAATQLDYDALGRLVGVTLPDGAHQRLVFDRFGRPSSVERSHVGTVDYAYRGVDGLLDHKDYRDAEGALDRTVSLSYDAIGRVSARMDLKAATGEESRTVYRYDGDIGDGAPVSGQRGYTTQTQGPAFTSTSVHNPDGTEAQSRLVLADWMQVDVTSSYYASGALRQAHRVITRLRDGAVIDDVTTAFGYDGYGRLAHVTVNGSSLADLLYDSDGRLSSAELPGGQQLTLSYDAITHQPSSYRHEIKEAGRSWWSGASWRFNNRGMVDLETLSLAGDTWFRQYGYDARGFLIRAQDTAQDSTYSYRPNGLPDQISDLQGTRTVFRGTARTLTAGDTQYLYDASGRVTARGDARFTYGPDGQLAQAQISGRTLSYRYDDSGNRLVKLEAGVPVAGFVGGGYLTDTGFLDPVRLGGRMVGVLEHGVFHLLATDPRGTLLSDRDGTARLATPYGVRASRPDLSAALDYVEKGYDADLGSVRIGVRDYDPALGQFWTPDPLYLEAIEKSAASPIDANLFSYARNNPISLIDPTGTEPGPVLRTFMQWQRSWIDSLKAAQGGMEAIEDRGFKDDSVGTAIKLTDFGYGDRNSLGPEYRALAAQAGMARAQLSVANHVMIWLEGQETLGRLSKVTVAQVNAEALEKLWGDATIGSVVGALSIWTGGLGPRSSAVTPVTSSRAGSTDPGPVTTLYHGGSLRGGRVTEGRFSTTPDPEHAAQYGQVHKFEIPTRRLYEIEDARGVVQYRDNRAGTSGSAVEWRFLGRFSEELNKYRKP